MNDLRDHGGNINAARTLFPDAPGPWIDLSTGINPVAYPVGVVSENAWTRLPDAACLAELEATARGAYGADRTAEVVAAPGTQALIQLLPRVFDFRDVGVLDFTYSEHERCWRNAGARVTTVDTLSELARFQVGVVVNPNNPDGRLCSSAQLTELAVALRQRAGLLIVDEAFMDFAGNGFSMAPAANLLDAVVLRSFGKTYGLAGIRLGFAISSANIGQRLRKALGPWPVSGPAIEIARRALRDTDWLDTSVTRLRIDCDRLDAMLKTAGFDIIGGSALFRLARNAHAQTWFRRLCQHGILTRSFTTKPDLLRFGIPCDDVQWTRLQACLLWNL